MTVLASQKEVLTQQRLKHRYEVMGLTFMYRWNCQKEVLTQQRLKLLMLLNTGVRLSEEQSERSSNTTKIETNSTVKKLNQQTGLVRKKF